MGHSEGNAVNRVEGIDGLDRRLMNGTTNQPADGPDPAKAYDEAVRWLMALRQAGPVPLNRNRRAFEQWLAASPEHARAFEECRADWDELEPLASVYGPSAGPTAKARASGLKPARNWMWTAGMAAMLAAVVTIGFFAAARLWPTYEVAASTQIAERRTLELIDGSRIELNGRSRVRVEYFRGRRISHMDEGEALFDVAGDPDRPFVVEAGLGTVRVVGTSFQVTREADRVAIKVVRGQVRVERPLPPVMTVVLSAGQGVNVTATGIEPVADVAVETIGTWRRHVLVFDRAPLREVVPALQRQYQGIIRLDPAASDIRLTAVVQFTDIEATLAALPASLPVRVDHPAPADWHVRAGLP